jgi:hypothetical protein
VITVTAGVMLAARPGAGVRAVTGSRRVLAPAGLTFVSLFLGGAMADWSGLLAVRFGASSTTAPLAYVAFTATWVAGWPGTCR